MSTYRAPFQRTTTYRITNDSNDSTTFQTGSMGFATAAFSVASEPVAIFILFVVAIVSGVFSLPNADRLIERCFDAIV